jgi:AcrR family transcriptional regulator
VAAAGYEGLTVEGVARAAGVGRPTIYRRFPTKAALVAAALTGALAEANPAEPDTGDVAADCEAVLGNSAKALSTTVLGRAVAELLGPARRDAALAAALDRSLDQRRDLTRSLLQRAEAQGRLLTGIEVGIDLLLGVLYFRHLITRQPLTAELTAIVATVVGPPPTGR